MMQGNRILVEYGIQTEDSDLRAHVCVNAGIVYVFPTKLSVPLVTTGKYRSVPVISYIDGREIITARGYTVPVEDIPQVIPANAKYFIDKARFSPDDSTSAKGDKAVAVVRSMLRLGWFPLPCNPEIIDDISMQLDGLDIIVSGKHRIQVKCDYRGGSPARYPDVTGNLFLQVSECNPSRAA